MADRTDTSLPRKKTRFDKLMERDYYYTLPNFHISNPVLNENSTENDKTRFNKLMERDYYNETPDFHVLIPQCNENSTAIKKLVDNEKLQTNLIEKNTLSESKSSSSS